MSFQSENTAKILDQYISGFHRYALGDRAELTFVSQNLCEMTGYTREELTDGDGLAARIHPSDRTIYDGLLERLLREKRACSAEYRLLRRDGSVLHVRDTVTVEEKDGTFTAYSILTDITSVKAENENLRFLNDTVPCGMLKYTCEKNPRVTYINQQMRQILRMPEPRSAGRDAFELYRDNVYLMIPMEERRSFSYFLRLVSARGVPVAGELSVLRCDGTRARLYGWVTKVTGEDGTTEFQSVCMDVTEQYHARKASATEQYLKALSDVYEKIFEYDFSNGTVKYVSGGSDTFDRIRDLPMHMEEATLKWIEQSVCPQDWESMRAFFEAAFARSAANGSRPPQIKYRVKKQDGVFTYTGIFLKVSSSVSLFCCRPARDEEEADVLRSENISLKNQNEGIWEMMRYTDGIAAFEVSGDMVTPLFANENVCEFFGFAQDEMLSLMKRSTSLREFVSRSAVDYERFSALLRDGEAEFTYYDVAGGTERRIKAICSQKQADGNAPRYVMLYKIDDDRRQDNDRTPPRVYIRTFGYFDVFIDDHPIPFRNKKAKELLALLVDRRGGYVSGEEAIGYLWENEPASTVTLARYRKEALRLKNALEEYGIGDIVESVDGKRRIIPERIRCDLYNYLTGKEEYASLFKGSYLTNYAWGEMTLGQLIGNTMNGSTRSSSALFK